MDKNEIEELVARTKNRIAVSEDAGWGVVRVPLDDLRALLSKHAEDAKRIGELEGALKRLYGFVNLPSGLRIIDAALNGANGNG